MQNMPESTKVPGTVAIGKIGKCGGVSIPERVVAPLIGAGANVYILTNELTQSMRAKLSNSFPFLQDTLNSRYAKLVAGGVLASVATIIFWKILKRLFKAKVSSFIFVQTKLSLVRLNQFEKRVFGKTQYA